MQALKYHNTTVMNLFDVTKIQGIWMYGIVIYLLGFAFSFVNVVPDQTAKDMKESGDYVIGVQPGIATERYITRRVIFFAVFGSMFLAIVVIFPMLLGYWLHNRMYTNLSNYFAMLFVLISIFDNLRQDIDMLYYKDSYGLFNVKVKRRGRAS
jgi:preprotein translocase subunit SecY